MHAIGRRGWQAGRLPGRRRHRRHLHRCRADRHRRLDCHQEGLLDAGELWPGDRRRRFRADRRGRRCRPTSLAALAHASTVATNAIIELKGARTGLITTKGFRDVLEMRRLRIPVLYDLQYRKPPPLVPRRLRLEVDERMGPRGDGLDAARRAKRHRGREGAEGSRRRSPSRSRCCIPMPIRRTSGASPRSCASMFPTAST